MWGKPMPKVEPLSPEQLCRRGDSGALTFETTAELDEPTEVLGQERAPTPTTATAPAP